MDWVRLGSGQGMSSEAKGKQHNLTSPNLIVVKLINTTF